VDCRPLAIPRIIWQGYAYIMALMRIRSSGRRNVEDIMVAAAIRTENNVEHHESSPSRGEVLARYRHLRQICKRHHSDALKLLSRHAILHQARRLGLADGKFFILDSMDELTLAFDLAIHTAPAGRSRAIDRYARSTQFASGSDEALMLEAMCNARFAIVLVQRRHQSVSVLGGWSPRTLAIISPAASTAFRRMASGRTDSKTSALLRIPLLAYCQRDTWANGSATGTNRSGVAAPANRYQAVTSPSFDRASGGTAMSPGAATRSPRIPRNVHGNTIRHAILCQCH
jgi:hypothetical protein